MYNHYITCMLVLFRSVAASKSNVHTGSYWSSHVYNERTKWYSSLDGNICLIFGKVSGGNLSIVSIRGHWMVWPCFPGVFVHRAHGQPWFHELLQLLLYRFVASAGRASISQLPILHVSRLWLWQLMGKTKWNRQASARGSFKVAEIYLVYLESAARSMQHSAMDGNGLELHAVAHRIAQPNPSGLRKALSNH